MEAEHAPLILNAGSGKDIPILSLAKKIAGDQVPVEFQDHPHPQSEIQKLLCNNDLAKQSLGFEPRWGLDQGLSENTEWLESIPRN